MKDYPSIPFQVRGGPGEHSWWVFDKIDGSLIRVEWTHKAGFNKFGRKDGLLDDSNPFLPQARPLFERFEEPVARLLKDMRAQKATVFLEFFGEHSFAGVHEDEPHELRVVDLAIHPHGYVNPLVLHQFCCDLPANSAAATIHHGLVNQFYIEQVWHSDIPGMTFEGVVFKRNERYQRIMFKQKSDAWKQKLRDRYKGDEREIAKRM